MKIFIFVQKVFFIGLTNLSDLTNANSLLNSIPSNCISMKNQECSGNFNNINNSYAKTCVPDIIKNLNVKVFNLMSRTKETRFIEWHKKCKCKCRLDAIVCNNN